MAQITEPQRLQIIKDKLSELTKLPPKEHEVVRLPGTGGDALLCQVIKMGVDDVLLNHRSHRVRAQLEDDPEWADLGREPYGEAAQKVIQRHVTDARKNEDFVALKESLLREGQTDPGVMTHKGVLVNANTRAVALREFEDPSKRYIRVAVLPETIGPEELALLELRLQMQKPLKEDYSMTNELLFIEELAIERKLKHKQIARELRIFPDNEKKGENEVTLRLRLLDLVRQMQMIPDTKLPLTFFDKAGVRYEQLRELHRTYIAVVDQDPERAQEHLETFLLSIAVGVTSVHQIRWIDPSFMGSYMLPQLQDDEEDITGSVAAQLAVTQDQPGAPSPAGVSVLMTTDPSTEADEVNLKGLINAVTQRDKRVQVGGTSVVVDQEDLKNALKAAVITGTKEKRRDQAAEDKLEAPIDSLKNATKELVRCIDSCKGIVKDAEFDAKHRKSLEAAFKKCKRVFKTLETDLAKDKIIAE
jgi:hypothetical protein